MRTKLTFDEARSLFAFVDTLDRLKVCKFSGSFIHSSQRLFIMNNAHLFSFDYYRDEVKRSESNLFSNRFDDPSKLK